MNDKRPSRLGALALLATSAIAVVIAASRNHHGDPASSPSGATPASSTRAAPGLEAVPSPSTAVPAAKVPGALDHVRQALGAVAAGTRASHVRIELFGDSHAQGEYWTGALRRRLQERFGDGGPGYVAAGSPKHRNDALRVETSGSFRVSPRDPATTENVGDGRFGLGGMLVSAEHHAGRISLSPLTPGEMTWDVCSVRHRDRDAIRITPADAKPIDVSGDSSSLEHTVVRTASPGQLQIEVDGASLCGVIGERPEGGRAGVVLDALGINGARFATPLAWDESSFESELARRRPDLVILEYGTNEEGDLPPHLSDAARNVEALVARIRRAAPSASCMVLGPTERHDRIDTVASLRDTFRDATERAGCAFWDTYAKMGGRGSMQAWQEGSPTRAQRDGIHLTRDGYEELGRMLYDDLVRGIESP